MELETSLSRLWHGLCNPIEVSGQTDKTGPETWLATATGGSRK